MVADACCAQVQSQVRAARPLEFTFDVHLAHCERCREVAGQYRWLAAELRALGSAPNADAPAVLAAIRGGLDCRDCRVRRVRAAITVAGGLVVAGAASVATAIARRERTVLGSLGE